MLLLLALLSVVAAQEVLQPPYFDIAKQKNITATATCGEDYDPPAGREGELFCALAAVPKKSVIGGLGFSCSHCVPGDVGGSGEVKDHNIRYANDGSNRWWQSPPLSRGLKYRKVNVTIDLGQSFHVAYVIVKAANSPRPGVWALERSNDGGKTYSPWHYFAPSSAECREYFGVDSYLPIVADDTVLCSTEYSQIPPFKDGEIHISLINGRPGASNFSYSPTLQEWTSATNVRLRLLDIKTLLTDLLPLSLEDPTVTRRYYYSIKDISIGGRCMCNGFADECRPTNVIGQYKCNCQYNTEGPRCDKCKEGYVQKKWRPRTKTDKFECEKCNCHGHSDKCKYNADVEARKLSLDIKGNLEGGGVCVDCLHNTHGINCEKCKPFFYRPNGVDITDPNACQPCECNTQFSTGLCAEGTGQCECEPNYTGRKCDQCNKGYHQFPVCKKCDCDVNGAVDGECIPSDLDGCQCKEGYTGRYCDKCLPGYFGFPNCQQCGCQTQYGAVDNNCDITSGQCRCKEGFSGRTCEQCDTGYYEFPYCKNCGCDPQKTDGDVCEAGTGVCKCKENYTGAKCEKCAPGFYGHPTCFACGCSTAGSRSEICDADSGRCECQPNYQGLKCNRCAPGYYGFPACTACNCNAEGTKAGSSGCDSQTGECACKPIYTGRQCDRCLSGFYGFPDCKQCNCNPAGTKTRPGGRFGDCSTSNVGQCVCKDNVQGLECNECKSGYYNLQENNPQGCTDCSCYRPGTNNGMTSCSDAGVCSCKEFVGGNKCVTCQDEYYSLKEKNMLGCTGCNCDVGGAVSNVCDKSNGNCQCRPNVIGRQCNRVASEHYYPTLHQLRFEMEDGTNTDGDPIRFDYQEKKFPGYTWKGFVFVNEKQPAVVLKVNIPRSSYYIAMFKYALNQISQVSGQITVKSESGDNEYTGLVNFPSTQSGSSFSTDFAKAQEASGRLLYLRLSSGAWEIKFETKENSVLYLDHLVLVPQQYSEARKLADPVQTPCETQSSEKLCNLYQYINLEKDGFIKIEAENPGRSQSKVAPLFNDTAVLSSLDFKAMILMSPDHQQQNILFSVPTPGKYIAVLQYYHDSDQSKYMDVYIRSRLAIQRGKAWLFSCRYKFGCRQTVLDRNNKGAFVFEIKSTKNHLMTLYARQGATVAVDSIILIPYKQWSLDYATPKLYCTTKDGKCTNREYNIPRDTVKIDVTEKSGDPRPSLINPSIKVRYLGDINNIIKVDGIQAGRYHVTIHYYQPNNPSFESRSGIYSGPGSGVPGRVNFEFCPNLNGCRAKMTNSGNRPYAFENGKARFRFDFNEGQNAWIEYILLTPEGSADLDDNKLEVPRPVQLSQDFKEQCSGVFFDVKETSPNFCMKSVFSLATDFNNGALACDCDPQGATSKSCKEFGGQCPCKPFVIGRKCSRCKIGYYGFPNCRPCNCSSTCDEITGQCTCPPGVIGDKCDRCEPGTFGFDPVIGCSPCNCDEIGTGKTNALCDVVTGQCPCLENYGTRKCSQCAAGYYNYPICQKCDCFSGGVTGAKCDAKTGSCICQENVIGITCDECPSGFFKTSNDQGEQLCTKCWCHGRSTKCKEAELYLAAIVTATQGWQVSLVNAFVTKEQKKLKVNLESVDTSTGAGSPQIIYWIAPQEYKGDQSGSYGGRLYYNFEYTVKEGYTPQPLDERPDVFISGNGILLKSNKKLSRYPNRMMQFEIRLHERYWLHKNGSEVSRDQMLTVLSKIEDLQIRATHDVNTAVSTLHNITMDAAVQKGDELIFGIEECFCPEHYTGPSCSQCAEGSTRQPDGSCGKCQCSGKSDRCNPENGSCFNCTENTTGDRCQQCKPGFYGDKCKPCECPSSDPENNFADSCGIDAVSSELVCKCKKGYTGSRCEKCADGYYGDPTQKGGSCKPCECSGNIDLKLKGNCDPVTGDCIKCLNNTAGDKCEKCKPGFFGDAIDKKNCADCQCDQCGSESTPCDNESGQCQCKNNVEGDRCNRCKPNTWNFDACQGCQDCNCGAASKSQQCDLITGKCECHPTVTQKRCDWCKLGYHSYTAQGCTKCDCPDGGYCDVNTGSCDCGFLGEKCTLCPPGHIIEDGKCVECDSCVQNILNRINVLMYNLTEIQNNIIPPDFLSNSSLDDVNKTLARLSGDANVFETDLAVLRKAIGFGDYGKYDGDQGFHKVEKFRNCEFGTDSSTAQPPIVITDQPVITTTPPPGETTTGIPEETTTELPLETTTELPLETTTEQPETTTELPTETTTVPPTTTTEYIVGPIGESTTTSDPNTLSKRKRRQAEAVERCPASLTKVMNNTQNKFTSFDDKVVKLEKDAYESLENATGTKDRAQDMLDSLKKFVKNFEDTLNSLNTTEDTSGGPIDSSASLEEAKRILKELRARNFSEELASSTREKESALNATRMANDLKGQATAVERDAANFNNSMKSLLEAFRNLKQESRLAKANAANASDLVNMAKGIEYQSILDLAEKIAASNNVTLSDAKEILKGAESALEAAEKAFKLFNNNTGPLADLMVELRAFVDNLRRDLDMALPFVERSEEHAKNLSRIANELSKVLKDVEKFAKTAIDAANVYGNIVKAIYDALEAAKLANSTAHDANNKAISAKDDAIQSKQKSASVNDEADALLQEVDTKLKVSISGLKKRSADLKGLRNRIQGRIDRINDGFKLFDKEREVGDRARNVSKDAAAAREVAKKGVELAKDMNEQLKKDSDTVKDLVQNITNYNDLIKQVAENVTKVENQIPTLNASVADVRRKYEVIEESITSNITNSIEYIKYLIANSHSLLDHIRLAMSFDTNTMLVLNAPKSAYDPSISNDISMVMKRSDGSSPNAMLFFIGNGDDPDNNDYLAMEMVNSKLVFHYKLSSGSPQSLTVDQEIGFGTLYTLKVQRNFGNGYAKVAMMNSEGKENAANTTEAELTASIPSPILNLGSDSDVYVGSVPDGKNVPSVMKSRTFQGCLEDLVYNSELMGLWDWKEQKNVEGCVREFRPADSGNYILNGNNSFVELDFAAIDFGLRKITLNFATLEKNGLIFLGMDPPEIPAELSSFFFEPTFVNFYALQLENGYLVSIFNFEGETQRIVHTDIGDLSDGKVHSITMRARANRYTRLKVDSPGGGLWASSIELGKKAKFKLTKAYVGGLPMRGYKPDANISTVAFLGSIGEVFVRNQDVALKSKIGFNYIEGFKLPYGHSASMSSMSSYLEYPACSITPEFPFGFSFETFMKEGVLVTASGPMSTKLGISLKNSQVFVRLEQSGSVITLESKVDGGVSDGEWHTVTLTIEDGESISLYLGTNNGLVKSSKPLNQAEIMLDGQVTFGRSPDNSNGFGGNIRQVYMCGNEVNLNTAIASEAKIGSNMLVAPLELPPPPTLPPPTTTTKSPPSTKPPTVKTTAATKPSPSTTTTTTTTTTVATESTTVIIGPIGEKTTTPEPATTTPEPVTTTSEPTTTPEPETTTPEPSTTTTTPEPTTTTPEPTTTTPKPSTTTPKPTTTPLATTKARPKCETKLVPVEKAYGFGLWGDESYAEFGVKLGKLDKKSQFEFYFYTLESSGLLLSTSTTSKFDYEYVYVNDGKITYVFNAGSGAISLSSTVKVNDGKWHLIKASRQKTKGFLTVDDNVVIKNNKPGASSVNGISKIYLGGIPTNVEVSATVPKQSQQALRGGMKGLKSFGEALLPAVTKGTGPAYNGLPLSKAVSFGASGGYVQKYKNFNVRQKVVISFDVRSRNKTGTLFHAYGKGDYLTITIESDGSVKAECNNGGGKWAVEVIPESSICNGEFHSILLEKNQKTLKLSLNGKMKESTSLKSSSSADTNSPAYFGGLPDNLQPKDYKPFHGCISKVQIRGKPVSINDDVIKSGSVMNGCAKAP